MWGGLLVRVWLLFGVISCGARTDRLGDDAGPLPPTPDRDAAPPIDPCDGRDADGDGYASLACGGDDCDDLDASVYPGPVRDHVWRSVDIEHDLPAQFSVPIALAPTGEIHAAYVSRTGPHHSRRVRHASLPASGREWRVDSMFPDSDHEDHAEPSIAIDTTGMLHVAFVRRPEGAAGTFPTGELTYARQREGEWTFEVVDRNGDAGAWAPAIAVDAAGIVHVSYVFHGPGGEREDDEVRHATNASGAWVTEIVHAGAAFGTIGSLALDSTGAAHLCDTFVASGGIDDTVGYATNADGAWSVETVILAPCCSASLALDQDDRPWITMATSQAGSAIAERLGPSNWLPITIELGGLAKDAASIRGGDPRRQLLFTAYQDDDRPAALRYAVSDGTWWRVEPVSQVPGVIRAMSGVLDATGQLHVVYIGSNADGGLGSDERSQLRYARRQTSGADDRSCE